MGQAPEADDSELCSVREVIDDSSERVDLLDTGTQLSEARHAGS